MKAENNLNKQLKMKKIICISLLSLLIVGCESKQEPLKEGHFRIHGKTTNLENGKLIFYKGYEADTVIVSNNSFIYEAPLETVSQFYLTIETDSVDDNMIDQNLFSTSLYLEPKIMDLKVDVKILKNTQLTGSSAQDDYYDLNKKLEVIKEPYTATFNKIERLYKEENRNQKAIDDAYNLLTPFYEKQIEAKKEFIKTKTNSFISLKTLNEIQLDIDVNELEELYNGLSNNIKEMDNGLRIAEDIKALKRTALGKVAPNFTTIDVHKNPLDLGDFKGNYVLLDFWGSWCNPCRISHPHLLEVYSEYSSKGFEIIGISDDDTRIDAWKKAIAEDKVGVWKHILRGKPSKEEENKINTIDLAKMYGVSAFPTKILLDKEGKIVHRAIGYDASSTWLEDKLAEVYGK